MLELNCGPETLAAVVQSIEQFEAGYAGDQWQPAPLLQEFAAAGKSFTSQGVEIFRVANGKLVERWVFIDQLPVMRELGIIPKPAAH